MVFARVSGWFSVGLVGSGSVVFFFCSVGKSFVGSFGSGWVGSLVFHFFKHKVCFSSFIFLKISLLVVCSVCFCFWLVLLVV